MTEDIIALGLPGALVRFEKKRQSFRLVYQKTYNTNQPVAFSSSLFDTSTAAIVLKEDEDGSYQRVGGDKLRLWERRH